MNKLKQTALDWIEAHVNFNVYDDCDAMHDLDKLEARFAALSDDKLNVQSYVTENMEQEYKDATKTIIKQNGTYPDDMENTPGTLLFKP